MVGGCFLSTFYYQTLLRGRGNMVLNCLPECGAFFMHHFRTIWLTSLTPSLGIPCCRCMCCYAPLYVCVCVLRVLDRGVFFTAPLLIMIIIIRSINNRPPFSVHSTVRWVLFSPIFWWFFYQIIQCGCVWWCCFVLTHFAISLWLWPVCHFNIARVWNIEFGVWEWSFLLVNRNKDQFQRVEGWLQKSY